MSTNEEKELIFEITSTVAAVMNVRCEVDIREMDAKVSLHELAKGDQYKTSHLMQDIHDLLHVQRDYQIGTEFELFETLQDVFDYFLVKVSEKRGIA